MKYLFTILVCTKVYSELEVGERREREERRGA